MQAIQIESKSFNKKGLSQEGSLRGGRDCPRSDPKITVSQALEQARCGAPGAGRTWGPLACSQEGLWLALGGLGEGEAKLSFGSEVCVVTDQWGQQCDWSLESQNRSWRVSVPRRMGVLLSLRHGEGASSQLFLEQAVWVFLTCRCGLGRAWVKCVPPCRALCRVGWQWWTLLVWPPSFSQIGLVPTPHSASWHEALTPTPGWCLSWTVTEEGARAQGRRGVREVRGTVSRGPMSPRRTGPPGGTFPVGVLGPPLCLTP